MRFFKWIWSLLFGANKEEKPEPILYFDRYILFKKAPLIGKLYQHGKKIWRVVGREIYKGRFKCELELI